MSHRTWVWGAAPSLLALLGFAAACSTTVRSEPPRPDGAVATGGADGTGGGGGTGGAFGTGGARPVEGGAGSANEECPFADLATDIVNCGACGIACARDLEPRDFGGKIVDIPRDGGDSNTLALLTGGGAQVIAASNSGVFWSDGTQIQGRTTGSESAKVFAAASYPLELVADGPSLFWAASGDILTQDVGSVSARELVLAPFPPNAQGAAEFAVDASTLYFLTDDGRVMKVARNTPVPVRLGTTDLGGSGAVQLALGHEQDLRAIAVDAANVYWIDRSTRAVMKVPIEGVAASLVLDGTTMDDGPADASPPADVYMPRDVASDGKTLYVTGVVEKFVSAEAVAGTGSVVMVDIGTGMVSPLASNLPIPTSLAIDEGAVYFAGSDDVTGTVLRIPIGGGAPITLLDTPRAGVITTRDGRVFVGTVGGEPSDLPLSGGACLGGKCQPCSPERSLCFGYCTQTQSDPYNCGTCGTICAPGRVCVRGACTARGDSGP